MPHEKQYGYNQRLGQCENPPPIWNSRAKVNKHFSDLYCDEDKLKKLVVKYGAVATDVISDLRKLGSFYQCTQKSTNEDQGDRVAAPGTPGT